VDSRPKVVEYPREPIGALPAIHPAMCDVVQCRLYLRPYKGHIIIYNTQTPSRLLYESKQGRSGKNRILKRNRIWAWKTLIGERWGMKGEVRDEHSQVI
jgi:hypothetical protein